MTQTSRLVLPMRRPEDVIPFLGKPEHWRQGRSAKALADSWFVARDMLASVRAVLGQAPDLAEAELLEAWLERETDLGDGRGAGSQTDILALLGVGDRLAVLGIEAKVDESFGPRVGEWLDQGGDNRVRRLAGLCVVLGIDPGIATGLRYQLFHRTVAVILEARRFRTAVAVLVVQSFCPAATGLADAAAFFAAIGLPGLARGGLVGPASVGGVSLRVGWAADRIPADAAAMATA